MAKALKAIIEQDCNRWSNDFSEAKMSPWLWLFEVTPTKEYSSITPASSGSQSILWRFTPLCSLHLYNRNTGQTHHFPLHFRLCQQIAFLDLEYRSNLQARQPKYNRIARYLENVRLDLLEELEKAERPSWELWQPDSTKPWAVRIKHNYGHTGFERRAYLSKCKSQDWQPYVHDEPMEYRMQ
jgi:hypothetical protein